MLKFVFARRLSGRIFRSFAMALVLLSITFGVFTTHYGSDLIVKSSANELRVLSVVLSQLIQDQFSNLEDSLDGITNNDTLLSQLASSEPRQKWLESYLKSRLKQDSKFLDLMIYDLEGRCVGSTDPDWYKIRGRSWAFFKQGLDGFNFPSIYATESMGRVQLVSSPILIDDQAVGVIVAIIDLQQIYGLMDRKIGLSETTDAFLLDRDLQFITAGRSGIKGLVESHLASTALASHIRDEFWVGEYAGASGRRVLGTALQIPGYSWYVVVERDYNDITQQVLSVRRGVIVMTLGLLLVFIIISLGLSRSITRPLMNLVESARTIASGHYHEPVRVAGNIEELAFIGNELDRMRHHVATSQNRLKERLSESEQLRLEGERLAAIGSLAASLAHEIRNPLNAMSLLLTRLQSLREEAVRKPIFEDLFGEVRRLDRLVSSILDYAKPIRLNKQPTDLLVLLCAVRDLFDSLAHSNGISLKVEDHSERLVVLADSDKLKQCLVNLIKNSVDALGPGGGEIRLSCVAERGLAKIHVVDNGPGIAIHSQEKIFTPFFTTKEQGTGLGLSEVHKIVTAHGGQIELNRAQGDVSSAVPSPGAHFVISIPLK